MIMSSPINRFWTYHFGSAVIQNAELNMKQKMLRCWWKWCNWWCRNAKWWKAYV